MKLYQSLMCGMMALVVLTGSMGCGSVVSSSMQENRVQKSTQTITDEAKERSLPIVTTETTAVSLAATESTTFTTSVSSVTTETNDTASLTDASGSFTYTGELQWIGDEEHGYLQVPADYMVFQDVDVSGLVQYCYGPYNIVTLQRFGGTSADIAAQNLYANLSLENNCERLETAEVPIATYEAKQIYAYYSDTMQYLVIWLIPDPEDNTSCYYLAMEFTEDEAELVACSSTFTPHKN